MLGAELVWLWGACLFVPLGVCAEEGDAPDAYHIVAAAAVPVLPEAIRPFFLEHVQAGRFDAVDASAIGSAPSCEKLAAEARYLMLDVVARGGDHQARRAAAAEFPRTRPAAQNLFAAHKERSGGALPWIAGERFQALAEAFEQGDAEAVLCGAGALIGLSTDASLPFNTTYEREGAASCRLELAGNAGGRGDAIHGTLRRRFQSALIQAYRPRFEYEVRVWPQRFQPPASAVLAAFAVMLEAHEALAAIETIDRELWTELAIADANTFTASAEAYYRHLALRAGPIMETRLEEGVLLAANLIGGAWIRAGSPPMERWTRPGEPLATATAAPAAPAAEPSSTASLVGSRKSRIFHRATCPHAARIDPANLVHFASVEAALAAGRKPCKTCLPETPPG